MAAKDFEGLTEEEQYELSRVVEGLQLHLDDVARRKEKNMDYSQATTRLHEDTTKLINIVDTINPKTIDFCGPSANPRTTQVHLELLNRQRFSNPLVTTPIGVRYRRY
jgi:hypothetical protein